MAEKRYSKNGEWVLRDGERYLAGLAATSVEELGEVTFVELPKPGRQVSAGEAVCTVEAVKAAADYYCPVDGRVEGVNQRLSEDPTLINRSPEGEGWILSLREVSDEAWNQLLDQQAWEAWERGR